MNIEELDLLDAPLTAINLNLSDTEISIGYRQNDEVKHLHFLSVRKVSADLPEFINTNEATINNVETEAICTGNTRVKFTFLFSASGPNGELQFEYGNLKVK